MLVRHGDNSIPWRERQTESDEAMSEPNEVHPQDAVESGPRPRRKGIYILPNLITLAALFGGFYSIVMAMNGRFEQAAYGVFCAMVLDSLDGRVARKIGRAHV